VVGSAQHEFAGPPASHARIFLQVLEVDSVAPAYISWKDTINLKPLSKVKIRGCPVTGRGIGCVIAIYWSIMGRDDGGRIAPPRRENIKVM
jgi:hypothetical protein